MMAPDWRLEISLQRRLFLDKMVPCQCAENGLGKPMWRKSREFGFLFGTVVTMLARCDGISASVAQRIEQEPSNLLVAGSIPAWGTFQMVIDIQSAFAPMNQQEAARCTAI